MNGIESVISKYTNEKCFLQSLQNGNKYCQIPSNGLQEDIIVHPNRSYSHNVSIEYSIINQYKEIDSLVVFYEITDNRSSGFQISIKINGNSTTTYKIDIDSKNGLLFELPKIEILKTFTIEISKFSNDSSFRFIKVILSHPTFYCSNELTIIANKYCTDKGSTTKWGIGPHLYSLVYAELFQSYKNKPVHLLEIGLDTKSQKNGEPEQAPSISMWLEYFKDPTIVGYDINNFSFLETLYPKFTFIRGNQGDRRDLHKIKELSKNKLFDIIIDDGSHIGSHQQISLVNLISCLKSGGLYIIEDLFWDPTKNGLRTLDFLKNIKDKGIINSPYCNEQEVEFLLSQISTLQIIKPNTSEIAIIKKN